MIAKEDAMERLRLPTRRRARVLVCAALFTAVCAAPGLALPRGYEEDFAGCRDRSKDAEDRERCCKKTTDDCLAECKRILDSAPESEKDYDASISCQTECTSAFTDCTKGPAGAQGQSGD
jgi:hypothetical protein